MKKHSLPLSDLTLLGHLLRDEAVSVGSMWYEYRCDEPAFHAIIQRLTKLECEIEQVDVDTYRLIRSGLAVWEDYLNYSLGNSSLTIDCVRVYRETASTQDIAKSMAPQQVVVLADHQTAGRGRLGRSWHSEPGSCALMSVSKRITGQPSTQDLLSMLTGLAVARAVQKLSGKSSVRLKWPNDVLIDGKKLAGILIEAVERIYIIGIGVNVRSTNQSNPSIINKTVSLAEIGSQSDRLRVIEEVLHQLGNAFRVNNTQWLLDEWRTYSSFGQTQTFKHCNQKITGEVIDLDPYHGLIVRRDSGEIVTLPAATTSVVG